MNQAAATTEYFASVEDPVQLASLMQEKITSFRRWAWGDGLMRLWEKKLRNYYGVSIGGNTSQAVTRGGAQGELSLIKVNDLHNLVQNQLVLVTSQRPAGQAKAINSDSESLKAARIGTAISEYYMSQGGFEAKFINAAEVALLLDEGFMDLFWDQDAGDPIAVDPQTQLPEMSGDCVLRIHAPYNVARDPGVIVEEQKWYIISYRVNRFDAAKKYPKFEEQILSVKNNDVMGEVPMNKIVEGSDAIYAHLLVHDRTPAVPDGRYSLMIGDYIVLDSKLPYKDFPVERIAPSDVIDGPTGYSSANDILALEEVTDALASVATTNLVNFGGQCIVGAQGLNIQQSDLGKGVRYFEVAPNMIDMLKPLNLAHVAPEVFSYMQMLTSKKEQQVGVNSVVRGQPEGQLAGASGSALALIQSQAISFNSGIQRSYFRLLSNVMTKLIGILRVYADTPRVAKIVGKTKAEGLKEFKYTGQDLNSISSIVFEMVNPLSQTIGGRMALGQDLIKAGMIKSPKEYINLVSTGQSDVLTQDDEADGLLILEENEWLANGDQVPVVITEMHADHIKAHMSVLSSPKAKQDPRIVQTVLAHIQDHLNQWQQASATNPGILMATGQQPLMPPPPPPGMMPPGGPQMPPPPPGAGPPGIHPPHNVGKLVGDGSSPAQKKAEMINEPHPPALPTVAGSNQKPVVPGVT